MKDKRKRWMINDDQGHPSDWPIPLSCGPSEKCAIWVWGDRKLAEQVVRLLNRSEEKNKLNRIIRGIRERELQEERDRLRVALNDIELIATPGRRPPYMQGKGMGAKLDEISRIAHQALAMHNKQGQARRENQ